MIGRLYKSSKIEGLNLLVFSKTLQVNKTLNSLSSERILSIFDHATLKNYISAVIYSSISSYTSLERAKKIKLSFSSCLHRDIIVF